MSQINAEGKAMCRECGEGIDKGGLFCQECWKKQDEALRQAQALEKEASARWREKNIETLLRHVGVPPRFCSCSLDNFLPHPPPSRPSFITGPPGTGKTHLGVGFLRNEILRKDEHVGRFLRAVDLFKSIRHSFRDNGNTSEQDILELYGTRTKFLVLDDLGAEKITEFVAQTLYDLIDLRYGNCLATLVTSNISLDQLAQNYGSHGDRLASRIAGTGGTLALTGKDRRWEV